MPLAATYVQSYPGVGRRGQHLVPAGSRLSAAVFQSNRERVSVMKSGSTHRVAQDAACRSSSSYFFFSD